MATLSGFNSFTAGNSSSGVRSSRTRGAAPQLLCPQGRDVNEEEAAFDGGRLGVHNRRVIGRLRGFLPLRDFSL